MIDIDFEEYYKGISNTELFNILDNAGDYQPLAIETAKKELNNRKLSESEIAEAKAPFMAMQIQKDKQAEKNKILEEKIRAAGESIFNSVKPFDTKAQNVNKKILFIVIICGSYFVLLVTSEFSAMLNMIKNISRFPFPVLFFLLSFIILPVALISFWRRRTIGWTLLILCVTFTSVSDLRLLYKIFTYKTFSHLHFDYLHKSPVRASDIFYLFIVISVIYVMCKKDIREIYRIDIPKMAGIIFLSVLFSFILLVVIS